MSNALDFFTIAGQRRYLRIALFLGKWLMALTSASVEKYLRSNFGRHYVYMLVSALFLFLVCSGLNPHPAPLTSLFLSVLFVLVIYHFIQVFRRRRLAVAEPHSASAGDPSSHEPDQFIATEKVPSPVWQRSLFNGLAQVIVQSRKEAGEIKLTARADGLTLATTIVQAKACPPRPSVP